jgi:hypothetical protein
MKTKFIPYINSKKFRETIFEIHNKEGNIALSRNIVNSLISEIDETIFKDTFLKLCKKFKVDYECYQINENDKVFFEITVLKSGLEYSKMKFHDKKTDITKDLAQELFKVVTIQIMNDYFINNAKK